MTMWKRDELAWAAGLIEGEGCFLIEKQNKRPDGRHTLGFRAVMHSTDEDVVRKLHTIIGLGTMTGPYAPKGPLSKKPHWTWAAKRRDEVYAICAALHEFMGIRRRGKVEELLVAIGKQMSNEQRTQWKHDHMSHLGKTYRGEPGRIARFGHADAEPLIRVQST